MASDEDDFGSGSGMGEQIKDALGIDGGEQSSQDGEGGESPVKQVDAEEHNEHERQKTGDKGLIGNKITSAKGRMQSAAKDLNPANKLKEKMKADINNAAEEDPYKKNHIMKDYAEGKADTNPMVRTRKDQFDKHQERKKEIQKKYGKAEDISTLMRGEKELAREKTEEKLDAGKLQLEMIKDTAKNVSGGPIGCLKEVAQIIGCGGFLGKLGIHFAFIGSFVAVGVWLIKLFG